MDHRHELRVAALRRQLYRIEKEAVTASEIASNAVSAVPFAGGYLGGLIDPAKGSTRLETSGTSGLSGVTGGIVGGASGMVLAPALAAAAIALVRGGRFDMMDQHELNDIMNILGASAAGGAVLGSSVGTWTGSRLGKMMARK